MLLNEKHVKESRLVALKAHGDQPYDKIYPYIKHIDDVTNVLKRFGITLPKYLIAARLHDSIEDGCLSYKNIKLHFGEAVAEMVYAVTDELGRTREEKKRKTLPKTAKNPDGVIIKLADRIANVEHGGKISMYKEEYDEFRKILYTYNELAEPLWLHLDKLLEYKISEVQLLVDNPLLVDNNVKRLLTEEDEVNSEYGDLLITVRGNSATGKTSILTLIDLILRQYGFKTKVDDGGEEYISYDDLDSFSYSSNSILTRVNELVNKTNPINLKTQRLMNFKK